MGPVHGDHSSEYYCRHILRSTLYTVFANRVSLEPYNSSEMLVVVYTHWILILCWR